jgi:hypothetical protein
VILAIRLDLDNALLEVTAVTQSGIGGQVRHATLTPERAQELAVTILNHLDRRPDDLPPRAFVPGGAA